MRRAPDQILLAKQGSIGPAAWNALRRLGSSHPIIPTQNKQNFRQTWHKMCVHRGIYSSSPRLDLRSTSILMSSVGINADLRTTQLVK